MHDTLRTARTADDATSDAHRVHRGTPGFAYIVAPLGASHVTGATHVVGAGALYTERSWSLDALRRTALLSLN